LGREAGRERRKRRETGKRRVEERRETEVNDKQERAGRGRRRRR
jgi:hypothetical protein